MLTFRKKYTWVGAERIAHYDEGTDNKKAILFLHGLPTSCYLWRKVVGQLREGYRCVAPDLMGLGDSVTVPDLELNLDSQARRLSQLIDVLELEKVTVVGHDVGGAVGQILAIRYGRHVDSLVLVDSACYDNWPVGVIRTLRALSSQKIVLDLFFSLGLARRLAYSSSGYRAGVRHPGSLGPRQIDEYLRPFLLSETARDGFRRLMSSLDNKETREIAHEFFRFTKPTLVVWGLDDVFFPLVWGERLATDFPRSTLKTISDCGHFVPEERPVHLVTHLERFLADLAKPA